MRTRASNSRVTVRLGGEVIADSVDAVVLEEAGHAPVYYLPRKDVRMERLERSEHRTHCPHKGDASYFSLVNGPKDAVWSYEAPLEAAAAIKERLAFYPHEVTIDVSKA